MRGDASLRSTKNTIEDAQKITLNVISTFGFGVPSLSNRELEKSCYDTQFQIEMHCEQLYIIQS